MTNMTFEKHVCLSGVGDGKKFRQSGFTLIETVVTLVVMAIAATVVAMAVSPAVSKIFLAKDYTQNVASVQSCMERIVAKHEELLKSGVTNAGDELLTAIPNLGTGFEVVSDSTSSSSSAQSKKIIISNNWKPLGEDGSGTYYRVSVRNNEAVLHYVFSK